MYDGIIRKLDNICHNIICSKTICIIYMYIENICRYLIFFFFLYLIFINSFTTVYETCSKLSQLNECLEQETFFCASKYQIIAQLVISVNFIQLKYFTSIKLDTTSCSECFI